MSFFFNSAGRFVNGQRNGRGRDGVHSFFSLTIVAVYVAHLISLSFSTSPLMPALYFAQCVTNVFVSHPCSVATCGRYVPRWYPLATQMPCTPTTTSLSGSVIGLGLVRTEIEMSMSGNSSAVISSPTNRSSSRVSSARERTIFQRGWSGWKMPMHPRKWPLFSKVVKHPPGTIVSPSASASVLKFGSAFPSSFAWHVSLTMRSKNFSCSGVNVNLDSSCFPCTIAN